MASIAPARKPLEYRFDQASFGRHQTFHLRYAWLTKGFQAMSADPRAFDADESTVTLGVGKNIRACRSLTVPFARFRALPANRAQCDRPGLPSLEVRSGAG